MEIQSVKNALIWNGQTEVYFKFHEIREISEDELIISMNYTIKTNSTVLEKLLEKIRYIL
jgi:hypothetical protein